MIRGQKPLTLAEHRALLNDLHHEIENRGRWNGEGALMERAYLALLDLTINYLTPDFSPGIEIRIDPPSATERELGAKQ